MIYVPDDTYSCYVVLDKDTIRAYHEVPTYQSSVAYTDFYINSHYLTNTGVQRFYNDYSIDCLDSSTLTTDFYYRNDLSDILLSFLIIVIIIFGIPYYLLKKFFRRM